MGDGQRQRVVAAAGPPLPHDEPDAKADEQSARDGREQRIGRQIRQQRRKQLPQAKERRNAQRGEHGHLDELPAQDAERQQITQAVEHRCNQRRRNAEPVFHKQHEAEDPALRDVDPAMDVIDAKGTEHRAQHDGAHRSPRQSFPQCGTERRCPRRYFFPGQFQTPPCTNVPQSV